MFRLHSLPASLRAVCGGVLVALLLLSNAGCVNALALMSKMMIGDPKATSKFESSTGVNLKEKQSAIIVHCSAPLSIAEVSETLPSDVEGELIRRMKLKKMSIVDQNRVVEALDSHGGRYDTQVLMNDIPEARYLFEIRIESCSLKEPHTPTMYHGRCTGTIVGYEFEGDTRDKDGSSSPRRMAQVFEQQFDFDHPSGHPIPREQMSESAFRKVLISKLTQHLGNMFYDVTSKELF